MGHYIIETSTTWRALLDTIYYHYPDIIESINTDHEVEFFADNNIDNLKLRFVNKPAVTGDYKIVSHPRVDGEVSVGATTFYGSPDSNQILHIETAGNNLHFTISKLIFRYIDPGFPPFWSGGGEVRTEVDIDLSDKQ